MLPNSPCELPEPILTDASFSTAHRRPSQNRERREEIPRRSATLKIVVVGTPKTGNTWLKHLLADVYDLPVVRLSTQFSLPEVQSTGPRWVAHQHFLPTQDLLDWGLENNV